MPHLLIAGATGSGKSVCINTIIMSILFKAKPEDVKMIMVDPKVVELSVYNGIPHLMLPVVTDCKKAAGALNWAVAEMDRRYKQFESVVAKNIEGYNKKVETMQTPEGQEPLKKMPQLVIIIDELADLMMEMLRLRYAVLRSLQEQREYILLLPHRDLLLMLLQDLLRQMFRQELHLPYPQVWIQELLLI